MSEDHYEDYKNSEEYKEILTLIDEGEHEKANKLIEEKLKFLGIGDDRYLCLQFLKTNILIAIGNFNEAFNVSKELYELALEKNIPEAILDFLITQGNCHLRKGDTNNLINTIKRLEETLESFSSQLSEKTLMAYRRRLYNFYGLYFWQMGEYSKALHYLNLMLKLAKKLNDVSSIAGAYNNLGLIYFDRGEYYESLKYFQKSLEYRNDESLEVSRTYNNLGFVYKSLKNEKKALEYFNKCYYIRKKLGNEREAIRVLDNIGEVYLLLNDHKRAKEIFDICVETAKRLEDKSELAWVYDLLGLLYKKQGDYPKALEYYNLSLQFNKDYNQKLAIAKNLLNVCDIYVEQGELDLALECCNQSLEFFRKIGNKEYIADGLHIKAKIFFDMGELLKAEELLKESLACLEDFRHNDRKAKILQTLSLIYCERNRIDKVEECLKELEKIKNKTSDPEIKLAYNIAKACFLCNNSRLIARSEGARIFETTVQAETTDFNALLLSFAHLCNFYLFEYSAIKSPSAVKEVLFITEKMLDLANKQESKKLLAIAYYYKAKLSVISESYNEAIQLLTEAQKIANKHKLFLLLDLINEELKRAERLIKGEYKEIAPMPLMNNFLPQWRDVEIKNVDQLDFQLKLIAYKWDELGFFPFAEAGDIELSRIFKEKYGTFISIATSLGSEYRNGLFGPLPFSGHKEYETLVYAEMVVDSEVNDVRLEDKNYLLLAMVYPKQYEKAYLFLRDEIKAIMQKYIYPELSVNEITNEKLEQLYKELMDLTVEFFLKQEDK